MNQRLARVREQLKEEVSDIVHKQVRDPRLGFVTITDAEVSVDLRHAKVFFTVLGDEAEVNQTTEALNSAAGFVRSEFGKRVRIKHIPEITFYFDPTIQRAARIEQLLSEIKSQEGAPGATEPLASPNEEKKEPPDES